MKKLNKSLYWTPRILSVLFLCFLTMFSLDVFEEGKSIGTILLGLLMHNLPTLILLVLLVIAWKKDIVGAVSFFIAGLFYIGIMICSVIQSGIQWTSVATGCLVIVVPAFTIGILFWLNAKTKNKTRREKI